MFYNLRVRSTRDCGITGGKDNMATVWDPVMPVPVRYAYTALSLIALQGEKGDTDI